MHSTSNTASFSHVIAALVGVITLAYASIAQSLGYTEFPAPFYWLDVAVVYFLAALPLASSIAAALIRRSWSPSISPSLLALQLATLFFIPFLYVHARTNSDISRAMALVQQSRYGEAGQLIHRTLPLAPRAVWNGAPLSRLANSIDETVAHLEVVVV